MPGPAAVSATGRQVKSMLLHLLLGAAVLPSPSAAYGQEVGDRVRVTLGDSLIVGRVSQLGEVGFEVGLQGGGSYSVMRADIVWLERSVTGSHAKGAAIGGGAVLGVLGLSAGVDGGVLRAMASATLGVVIGGGIGAAVGSAFKWTRWEAIPIAGVGAIPAIGLAGGGGRVGLELGGKLRF